MATEITQDVDNTTAEEEIPYTEPSPPKAKNPKRVEQGKKLAEWNKKNKQKAKAKVFEQNESPTIENVSPKNNNINYWVLGGTIVVGGLVVGVLYFTQRGAQVEASLAEASLPTRQVQVHTPSESKPQADDFDMA